jgi:hypothetical protein
VSPERRIDAITAALECYPELAAANVRFRDIAYWCAKGIPNYGLPEGVGIETIAEAASEATVARMYQPDPPRGEKIARYLVVIFRAIASGKQPLPEVDTLSRLGSRLETVEMQKTEAEAARRRAEDAARPPPDPALPKAFLAAFPPPPDPGAWPTAGGVKRPALRPRPEPHSKASGPTRIGHVVDGDMMREERELADANEQWRRT